MLHECQAQLLENHLWPTRPGNEKKILSVCGFALKHMFQALHAVTPLRFSLKVTIFTANAFFFKHRLAIQMQALCMITVEQYLLRKIFPRVFTRCSAKRIIWAHTRLGGAYGLIQAGLGKHILIWKPPDQYLDSLSSHFMSAFLSEWLLFVLYVLINILIIFPENVYLVSLCHICF